MMEMTLAELAETTGESLADLERWRALGLLGSGDRFDHVDVERVRLCRLFLRCGVSLEDIVSELRDGSLAPRLERYLSARFPGSGRRACSVAQAAERVGMELELFTRLWNSATVGKQLAVLNEKDIEMMRGVKAAMEAGFPEEALTQLLRVYADTLGRAAGAAGALFHFYVDGRAGGPAEKLSIGDHEAQRLEARLVELSEPAVLYFHRRGATRAMREDMVWHLASATGLVEPSDVPGQLLLAMAFVDLSSFTPLAEAMGDLKTAEVLQRFGALVRESVSPLDGRVIKQIGDAFMLSFPEPGSAVSAMLNIVERAGSESQFPAVRGGVHWGPVLYREGDYLGSSVNIASRIAEAAGRRQVLVTAAVRQQVRDLVGVEFAAIGKKKLKGVVDEIELFEARRERWSDVVKGVDPVCGMELRPAEVSARVEISGHESVFCSQECLRRYVAAPERYPHGSSGPANLRC